jgi:hypothetical protein
MLNHAEAGSQAEGRNLVYLRRQRSREAKAFEQSPTQKSAFGVSLAFQPGEFWVSVTPPQSWKRMQPGLDEQR